MRCKRVCICVLIKSEGRTIAIEYIKEKRDTFCDTHKQADGRGTKQKKKAKAKRETRGRKLISSFSPSADEEIADEEKTKKTLTRTPF